MSYGQSARDAETDEATWVAKFTKMGGDEHKGRELYQRMKEARKVNASTSAPPQTDQSNSGLPNQQNSQSHAPQKATAEPELFENLPIPQPPLPTAKQTVAPLAHDVAAPQMRKKRGRPAVTWSDRPKRQTELDLFDLSLEIEQNPAKDRNQLGVIATAMIYASLPHSRIEGPIFKRKNGDLSITIMNDPDIGLPYGKLPRLITAFLCTEAKRTKEPTIFLGHSKNEFAQKLGLGTGGGPRGGLTLLNEQAKRLFTSHITLIGSPNSQFHWRNITLTDNGMLLWDPHDPQKRSPWESKLTLSQTFFEECITHSVPIDMRVLHKLRSPLAIDIYIWLTYRYNAIKAPTKVSWTQLKWQFGSNYADDERGLLNFIGNFKSNLRNVSSVYREAMFRVGTDTLTLLPSPPHVLPPP